jgi:hypothetical protein
MEIPIWKCPRCNKQFLRTQEKEIEEHDCFSILDDDDDLFALDPSVNNSHVYYE